MSTDRDTIYVMVDTCVGMWQAHYVGDGAFAEGLTARAVEKQDAITALETMLDRECADRGIERPTISRVVDVDDERRKVDADRAAGNVPVDTDDGGGS